MPSIKIVGKVKKVGDVIVKNDFRKRELIVETEEQYSQVIAIEFVKDKEAELDLIQPNDRVEVECNMRGRAWTNQDGEEKYFLSVQAWKLTKL